MKKTVLLFVGIFAISVIVHAQVSYTGCPTGNEVVPSAEPEREDTFFNLLNQVRLDTFGITTPLVRNVKLDNAAHYHVNDMKTNNYWCHNTFDNGGTSGCAGISNNDLAEQCNWNDRINKFLSGTTGTYYVVHGLGIAQTSAKQVIDAYLAEAWDGFPGQPHRDILQDAALTVAGVGVLSYNMGGYYWDLSAGSVPLAIHEFITKGYFIGEAYPNPFSEQSIIRVKISKPQQIRIEMLNLLGQKVMSVYSGRMEANTEKEFTIRKAGLPPGVYFCRVKGEQGINEVRKVTVR